MRSLLVLLWTEDETSDAVAPQLCHDSQAAGELRLELSFLLGRCHYCLESLFGRFEFSPQLDHQLSLV